jgi:hypothetical protein
MLKYEYDNFQVILPPEYEVKHHLIYPHIEKIWNIINKHVILYIGSYNINESDQDIKQWKKYIEMLIRNKSLRNKLGKNGKVILKKNHDLKLISKKLEALYKNLF